MKPPWWRWFEPPNWWPGWLHALTCTYCRGMRRYGRQLRKGVKCVMEGVPRDG